MVEANPYSRGFVFYGKYNLTIDDKNRVLVPAEIRRCIEVERDGDAFFMVVGQNERLWLYPDKYYKTLAAQIRSGITLNDDILVFRQLHFALASRLEWDKQGRMVVPEESLNSAMLTKDVTLIGADDHLEIWNRSDWIDYEKQLRDRRREILQKVGEAQQMK